MGSFLNVVLFRLNKKGGLITGRSECVTCLKQINWYDLFPVLSFILLRGKCRNCKSNISLIYPFVELVTGFCFLFFYIINGPLLEPVDFYFLFIIAPFVVLVLFDYLYFLIPDKIIFPLAIFTIFFNYFFRQPEFINLLLSALAMGGIFAIINLSSKGEWVGFGDAKLMFLIGLILGYPLGLVAMVLSVWTGALVGIGLMLAGKANRKTALPFGSFLSGVSILIIIFQNEIQKFSERLY